MFRRVRVPPTPQVNFKKMKTIRQLKIEERDEKTVRAYAELKKKGWHISDACEELKKRFAFGSVENVRRILVKRGVHVPRRTSTVEEQIKKINSFAQSDV